MLCELVGGPFVQYITARVFDRLHAARLLVCSHVSYLAFFPMCLVFGLVWIGFLPLGTALPTSFYLFGLSPDPPIHRVLSG